LLDLPALKWTADDEGEGTTTAFSITGYDWLSESWEYYKDRPAIDEWRAHRTLPTTEFFAGWTQRYEKLIWFISPCPNLPGGGSCQTRANNWDEEEELLHQELTEWIPDLSEAEEIEDPIDRELEILRIKYPAASDKVLVLSISTNRVECKSG